MIGGSGQNVDAAFFSLRSQVFEEPLETGAHLTMDQMAAYVDRHLSGEELHAVDDHLTHCETCVLAVKHLRDFRNEIAPSLDHGSKVIRIAPVLLSKRRSSAVRYEIALSPLISSLLTSGVMKSIRAWASTPL